MKRKMNMQRPFLFFVLLGIATAMGSCQYSDARVVRGDGNVTTQTLEIGPFNVLELAGSYNVVLTAGNEASLTIETDENLHDLLDVKVRNETLTISSDRESVLKPSKMNVYVVYPELKMLQVSGACKIASSGLLTSETLKLDLSGAAEIDLELEVGNLQTMVAGAGKITYKGQADEHRAELSGASNLDAEHLITIASTISISGAGSASVHASKYLKAAISGVGKISYYGNPTETHFDKSGLGTIRSASH